MSPTAEHMVRALLGERTLAAARRADRYRRRDRSGGFDPVYLNGVAEEHDVEAPALRRLFGFHERRDAEGRLAGYTRELAEAGLPTDPDELTALALSRWVMED